MIDRRGGKYRVRLYWRSRYIGSRTFTRLRAAEAYERSAKDALAAGRPFDLSPTAQVVTVAECAAVWLSSKTGGKPTAESDRQSMLRNHVLPVFGRRHAGSLTRSEVQAWARGIARDRSASLARRALGALRGALSVAVEAHLTDVNVAVGVNLPAAQGSEPNPLTHEQVWGLADAMTSWRDRLIVLVCSYGGLRWGEVTALERADVSDDGRTVTVRHAWSDVAGVLHWGDTKSHQRRTLSLPNSVALELAAYLTDSKLLNADFVFHGRSARTPLRNSNWVKRQLAPAVTAANLGRRVTPHQLRETAASLAIQAGVPLPAVSRMLGHQQMATTMAHYIGLFPSDNDRIADLLDTALTNDRVNRYPDITTDPKPTIPEA